MSRNTVTVSGYNIKIIMFQMIMWMLMSGCRQTAAVPCRSKALCRWVGSSLRCWRDWSCCRPTPRRCPPSPPRPLAPNLPLPERRTRFWLAFEQHQTETPLQAGGRRLPRARDRGCWGCSSAHSPAPPSLGSWRSSAMFPRRRRPALAGPDEPRPSPSPSEGHASCPPQEQKVVYNSKENRKTMN